MNPLSYGVTINDDGKEKQDYQVTLNLHFAVPVGHVDVVTFLMQNMPSYFEGVTVFNKRKKPAKGQNKGGLIQ